MESRRSQQELEEALSRVMAENEQLRQTCVTHETLRLLTDSLVREIAQLRAERDAALAELSSLRAAGADGSPPSDR